ncbi:AAA family ATPase [Alkalibacterium olivapovliticus]|uniref:Dynein-related subfamily AAA family protein n=1 Tax=Alkalibacterium olivapovliticus TaxID=99907 RepID=A0A2T0VT14_9LACT|nr:AAA family ATPase [Alkalibacterium olivapovliticus]PRY73877.1 dynein-related subfamily AAA family protein [Alkalibacterium olivapovliticus]
MKIMISKLLMREFRKYEKGEKDKITLLDNIERKQPTSGVKWTPVKFINKMIDDINFFYENEFKEEAKHPIQQISLLSEVETFEENKNMYIGEVRDEANEVWADFVIANADKFGNTLITQQLMSDLIEKIAVDINYIFSSSPKKFVYLTFYIDSSPGDTLPKTGKSVLSSVKTLGYKIVEMFPSKKNKLAAPYMSTTELIRDISEDYTASKRKSSLSLFTDDLTNDTLKLTIDGAVGQHSKYYSLYLLAYYRLKTPRLIFELEENIPSDLKKIERIFNTGQHSPKLKDAEILEENFQPYVVSDIPEGKGVNLIYYGAPGSGKSYRVNQKYNSKNSKRITFYPDYDYNDFVGGLKPVKEPEKTMEYKFVSGPLVDIIISAINNPLENFYLIIEELNRANAPSVFGDTFQLLDRDKNTGISTFSIFNSSVGEYIDNAVSVPSDFKDTGIVFPGNLSIIATLNPADQMVFSLDSAFQRRWQMVYVPIDWTEENVVEGPVEGFEGLTWKKVGKTLNIVLSENGIEEDSLLGQYYITDEEIKDIDLISSKLIGYLWNDVLKYQKDTIFKTKTLSQTIKKFKSHGYKSIFQPDIVEMFSEE